MPVRLRLKHYGRKHRPFFRLVATDIKAQRDGRVIEELGFYDPMVRDANARAILEGERIQYWLGVGAQPSETARVLIKKFGKDGTHLKEQKLALEQLGKSAPRPKRKPKVAEAKVAEEVVAP